MKLKTDGEESNNENISSHSDRISKHCFVLSTNKMLLTDIFLLYNSLLEATSKIMKINHVDVGGSENEDSCKDYFSDNDVKSVGELSSGESEGGTYTLDEDNKQVQVARKSIDQVFGISSATSHDDDLSVSSLQITSIE